MILSKKINLDILTNSVSKDVIDYLEIKNHVASELINFTQDKKKFIIELTKESLTLEIKKKTQSISKSL